MTEIPARMMRSRSWTRCRMKVTSVSSRWVRPGVLTRVVGRRLTLGTSEEETRLPTQGVRSMACHPRCAQLHARTACGGAPGPGWQGRMLRARTCVLVQRWSCYAMTNRPCDQRHRPHLLRQWSVTPTCRDSTHRPTQFRACADSCEWRSRRCLSQTQTSSSCGVIRRVRRQA
jgi:hypothetical protein